MLFCLTWSITLSHGARTSRVPRPIGLGDSKMSKHHTATVPPTIKNPWHLFLAIAAYVRRILLHSEKPGTGKTSAGIALALAKGAEAVCITLTDGMMASDMLGFW